MPETMVVYETARCIVCNETSQITVASGDLFRWRCGAFVQDVWPQWTPAERERMITGTHPACWDEMFGDDDDDDG